MNARLYRNLFLALVASVGLGTTVLGQRQAAPRPAGSGQHRRPVWPPPVQKVRDIVPPLSPEAEMKTFYLPPGYHVELIAAEPLVQDPVAIDYDADGRMWVLEMTGFANNKEMTDSHEPIGRVAVLEDTNNDGKMDKRTVFIEGLVLPRALKVLEHGVLIGEPPNLWVVRDTDGDLKADTKELIRNDFGRLDGNLEHNANSLFWALDNRIYTSEHDWAFRFANGKVEGFQTLSRGQWGVTQDDAGRLYRNTNTEGLFVDLVPAAYFVRNANVVRTRGAYERLLDPDKTAIWPVRPTRGINRGYREGLLRPDGTAAYYAGVSSPTVYRGDRLPAELSGNVFVVDSPTNLVHRLIVKDDGSGSLSAHDAYEKGEFLASTDERFRPVNLFSAPDGTLQVVDMYRGVVQDIGFQTEYLKDYIAKHQLELPVAKGRIFRIVHDSTKRDAKPQLSKETPAGLVGYLSHPNGWWRDTAQRLLVERGDKSVAPALTKLAAEAPDYRTRLHALWTLDGLDALDPKVVQHALQDATPEVRASAVRLSERWLRDPARPEQPAMQTAVLATIDDANHQVRWQLAATLGELPAPARVDPLTTLLGRFGDDPVLVDVAISSLHGQEAAVLTRLLDRNTSAGPASARQASANESAAAASPPKASADGAASAASAANQVVAKPSSAPQPQAAQAAAQRSAGRTDEAIQMLAGAVTKGGEREAIQRILAAAVDANRPEAVRVALLLGLDAGLSAGNRTFGGAVPSGGTGRVAMAAGSVPGADLNGRSGARPVANLTLPEEPKDVTRLAAGSGRMAEVAGRIVAKVSWPGKPEPVVPPLTAAEQTRYAAGAEIYKNICINCHQPDGRGKEHLAPALVGSKFALASPVVPVRILLSGKEGTIGLMPPLSALTDDQIAAVLTYIRREWGNTASAVDAPTVKEVRGLTASHARPWTEAELARLASAGRPGAAPPP
jgi:mono/diheme cytochrome c family protein/HEAT repeat protein